MTSVESRLLYFEPPGEKEEKGKERVKAIKCNSSKTTHVQNKRNEWGTEREEEKLRGERVIKADAAHSLPLLERDKQRQMEIQIHWP